MNNYKQVFEYSNGIIYQANCEDFIKSVASESIDGTFIDPPYTNGKVGKERIDVLAGHKIQTAVDIQGITNEIYRTQKNNTFYAFFGQMPSIRAWEDAAYNAGFKFVKAIVWAKRNSGISTAKIQAVYELIFIFKKGEPKFNKAEGNYTDVAQPMTELGLKNIESAFRQIGYLKGVSEGRKLKNVKDTKRQNNDSFYQITEFHKNNKPHIGMDLVDFTNIWAFKEEEYEKLTNYVLFLENFYLENRKETDIYPDFFSFLPHNCANRNEITGRIKHPTVKSIPCMQRLIELCTPDVLPSGKMPLIADWYLGSGTSALANIRSKRRFIGTELLDETQEQGDGYFTISKKRIIKELNQTQNTLLL